MRPLAALHAVVMTVLLAGLVVQVFLAGLGVFDDPSTFLTHASWGYVLEGIALLVVLTAALAKAGRSEVGRAGLVFGLFFVQSILVAVRDVAPQVAALHPVNGFLILLLTVVGTRAAWRAARGLGVLSAIAGGPRSA